MHWHVLQALECVVCIRMSCTFQKKQKIIQWAFDILTFIQNVRHLDYFTRRRISTVLVPLGKISKICHILCDIQVSHVFNVLVTTNLSFYASNNSASIQEKVEAWTKTMQICKGQIITDRAIFRYLGKFSSNMRKCGREIAQSHTAGTVSLNM